MTPDLARHPYFQPWVDPESGITSYLLSERVAPLQKAWYYHTPSVSDDNRWLWFYASFPPSRQWFPAAVCLDPDDPRFRTFPGFVGGGNPVLIDGGSAAYVTSKDEIYRQPLDGQPELIFKMPGDVTQGRHLFTLVTDLSISADGKYFVLDSRIGNRWLISTVEIATGEITPLRWFHRCHHHAVFSPTDPEQILVGQGPYVDAVTGDKGNMDIRLWIMDTKRTYYEPLQEDMWFGRNSMSCHEWFTADGKIQWVDYWNGLFEVDPHADPRKRELFWEHKDLCHGQTEKTLRYSVADENPYKRNEKAPCRVLLYDRTRGEYVPIVSSMIGAPLPPGHWRAYHLDPHPHFSADGSLVVYTSTVADRVDVAVTPTSDAIDGL